MSDEKYMRIAIEEAKKGDNSFGAVIVKSGEIISISHNTSNLDPTAHGEINAIREACRKLNSKDLSGCTLYTTCEPCPMCFMACWWANISKIIYGAEEADLPKDDWIINISCSELNERSGSKIEIRGGFLRDECKKLFDK